MVFFEYPEYPEYLFPNIQRKTMCQSFHIYHVHISQKSKSCVNAKSSTFLFSDEDEDIGRFQIYISVPFKHLLERFPWLELLDKLLLGLWKEFCHSGKNRSIFKQIQEAYGLKTLNLVKEAVTQWLLLVEDPENDTLLLLRLLTTAFQKKEISIF